MTETAMTPDTSAPTPGRTTSDLLAFLDYTRRAGLLPETSIATYRQGLLRILSAQPDPQAADIITLETEAAIARFTAANPDLAPASLRQYASGFRKAQHLLRDYHANPARWHAKAGDGEHGWQRHEDGALELHIPLARNREIQLILPPDYGPADMPLARRILAAYLRGLIPTETTDANSED